MGAMPDFEVGSLGSLLIGLRSFYRRLGFQVELAYIRMGGKCACGDNSCVANPHFVSDEADRTQGIHLVMNASNALATRDLRILNSVFGRLAKVPVLKHEGTVYIFVLDPKSVPDLFPVLGSGEGLWISLPPQTSDDIVGAFGLPAWLTPLDLATDQLPDVGSVFHPVVIERWEQLRALGEDLQQRLCGNEILNLTELLSIAAETAASGDGVAELLDLVGKACIGDIVTLDHAYEILYANQHFFSPDVDLVESLHRTLYDILFVRDDLDAEILEKRLFDAALSLIDVEDDVEDDVEGNIEDDSEYDDNVEDSDSIVDDSLFEIDEDPELYQPIGLLDEDSKEQDALAVEHIDEPDFDTKTSALDLWLDEEIPSVFTGELVETLDPLPSDKIDWASALREWNEDFSALALAMHLLSVSELSLEDDTLTKLALIDMLVSAFPAGGDNLVETLGCIWPTIDDFATGLRFHAVVVQLFAGMLLRFKMIGDAGMLPEVPTLLEQLASGRGDHIFSDLIRSPQVLFWLDKHVLLVTTPGLLAQRVEFVATVLEIVRDEIIEDISTTRFLKLIEEIDD